MKSVYSISLKKYGTYINLKIRDMGYPKKIVHYPKKAVQGVLLKFRDRDMISHLKNDTYNL